MNFPKRIPGAHLPQPVPAPEDGWFGPPVEWPSTDEDLKAARRTAQAAACYLEDCDLPAGEEAEELFIRVLDGFKHLDAGRQ